MELRHYHEHIALPMKDKIKSLIFAVIVSALFSVFAHYGRATIKVSYFGIQAMIFLSPLLNFLVQTHIDIKIDSTTLSVNEEDKHGKILRTFSVPLRDIEVLFAARLKGHYTTSVRQLRQSQLMYIKQNHYVADQKIRFKKPDIIFVSWRKRGLYFVASGKAYFFQTEQPEEAFKQLLLHIHKRNEAF